MTIPLSPSLPSGAGEWWGESGSGHKGRQKSTRAWFSSKFAPFPAQLLWFCGQGAVIEVWIYFTILCFLSNLFETIHYTCIESFEFRSHEFGNFALQPQRRTGPGWMTAHMSSSTLEWAQEKRSINISNYFPDEEMLFRFNMASNRNISFHSYLSNNRL